MLYPEFTENAENGVTLYFPLGNKTENELIKELEKTYYCYAAVGAVKKDGKPYIALSVEDDAS